MLPLSLQKTGRVTVAKPPPQPWMVTLRSPRATLAPSWAAASSVARMSSLYSMLSIRLAPSASAAHSTARWAALLLGGTARLPPMWLTESFASTGVAPLSLHVKGLVKGFHRVLDGVGKLAVVVHGGVRRGAVKRGALGFHLLQAVSAH